MVATIGQLTIGTGVSLLVDIVRLRWAVAKVIVDMLSWQLIVAGVGMSDDRVGSACSSVGIVSMLAPWILTMFTDRS